MKLLVLHSQLGTLRGGGENFSRHLFASFATLGHQVSAAFAVDVFGRYPFPLPAAIETLPIRGVWSDTLGQATLSAVGRSLVGHRLLRQKWDRVQNAVSWRAYYWNNWRFQRRVLRRMARTIGEYDAIYVHSNPFLASAVAQIRPTVLRLPGPLTSELLPVLQSIQAVCANGDALKRIRTFLGDRAIELPIGLDDRQFSPGASAIRGELGWTREHKVVGYVGRLSHIKGVDLLAESFRAVSQRDRTVRLLIVGSGEEARNVRTTLAAEIGRGVVHMAGDVPHPQLPAYYRAMDLLVMPSRYENYSNSLLEGLACGVPFVGSDVGGNQALAETGAGWLFSLGSAADLASSMTTALADDRDRDARGTRGRQHVAGRFSWEATARRLEEIIRAIPLTTPRPAARWQQNHVRDDDRVMNMGRGQIG
jgi:glycosyltransferase involved in cell wall biosynthesis